MISLALLISCNSGHDYVYNHDNIYVMSQPSQANQKHFLFKGGKNVIEVTSSTAEVANKIDGLNYSQFSWDGNQNPTPEQLKLIKEQLGAKEPVLLHSSQANLAPMTLALYLFHSGQKTAQESLEIAREIGLTETGKKQLKSYLK